MDINYGKNVVLLTWFVLHFCIAPVRKVIIKKRNNFKKKSGDGDKQSDLLDDIDEFDD